MKDNLKTESVVKAGKEAISIPAPNFQTITFKLKGTAPYVQHRFSAKAKLEIKSKQMAGPTARKGKKKEARDFDAEYKAAMHISTDGWYGQPAAGYRNAAISACRTVGFAMTRAKLGLFIEADGFDAEEGTPLIRIKGKPEQHEAHARIQNTTTIVVRPMWREWSVDLRVKFDADMFTASDVANLMMRIGQQVGVGEGRPDSKTSCGMGWGTFEIVNT